jgi:hypothetical protein
MFNNKKSLLPTKGRRLASRYHPFFCFAFRWHPHQRGKLWAPLTECMSPGETACQPVTWAYVLGYCWFTETAPRRVHRLRLLVRTIHQLSVRHLPVTTPLRSLYNFRNNRKEVPLMSRHFFPLFQPFPYNQTKFAPAEFN